MPKAPHAETIERNDDKLVFFHFRPAAGGEWQQSRREFARLPCRGEYVALTHRGPWCRVELVVHCPFEATYAAEIDAVECDSVDAMRDRGISS